MQGLLADVNIQGHLRAVELYWSDQGYDDLFGSLGLTVFRFPDFDLPQAIDDRTLWHFCQDEGRILLTDNRNHEDESSLEATLSNSLEEDSLPVLTPESKENFQHNRAYQRAVAESIAEILFGVAEERKYLGVGRIVLPLPEHV